MARPLLLSLFTCCALFLGCDGSSDPDPDPEPDPVVVDAPPADPELFGISFGEHHGVVVEVAEQLTASGMSDATLAALVVHVKELSAPEQGLTAAATADQRGTDVGTWFAAALGELEGAQPAHVVAAISAVMPTLPPGARMDALQLLVGRVLLFWDPRPEHANPLMNALTVMIEDLGYISIVLHPLVDPAEQVALGPNPLLEIYPPSTRVESAEDGGMGGSGYGGTGGCGQQAPAYMPDPWCDEHKDDLANATIDCIKNAVCGLLAEKLAPQLGSDILATLLADDICDEIADKIKRGIGIENMELGPPYFQDAPKPLTAIFPPIDLAQKIVSCGINLPAAILTAGFSHLYCFNYTSTHGQPVQYQPCPPAGGGPPPGNAICSRAGPDDPSCAAGCSEAACNNNSGACRLGVAGSGCRCVSN